MSVRGFLDELLDDMGEPPLQLSPLPPEQPRYLALPPQPRPTATLDAEQFASAAVAAARQRIGFDHPASPSSYDDSSAGEVILMHHQPHTAALELMGAAPHTLTAAQQEQFMYVAAAAQQALVTGPLTAAYSVPGGMVPMAVAAGPGGSFSFGPAPVPEPAAKPMQVWQQPAQPRMQQPVQPRIQQSVQPRTQQAAQPQMQPRAQPPSMPPLQRGPRVPAPAASRHWRQAEARRDTPSPGVRLRPLAEVLQAAPAGAEPDLPPAPGHGGMGGGAGSSTLKAVARLAPGEQEPPRVTGRRPTALSAVGQESMVPVGSAAPAAEVASDSEEDEDEEQAAAGSDATTGSDGSASGGSDGSGSEGEEEDRLPRQWGQPLGDSGRQCTHCGEEFGSKRGRHPASGALLCMNCVQYVKRTGTDRPASIIAAFRRAKAEGRSCRGCYRGAPKGARRHAAEKAGLAADHSAAAACTAGGGAGKGQDAVQPQPRRTDDDAEAPAGPQQKGQQQAAAAVMGGGGAEVVAGPLPPAVADPATYVFQDEHNERMEKVVTAEEAASKAFTFPLSVWSSLFGSDGEAIVRHQGSSSEWVVRVDEGGTVWLQGVFEKLELKAGSRLLLRKSLPKLPAALEAQAALAGRGSRGGHGRGGRGRGGRGRGGRAAGRELNVVDLQLLAPVSFRLPAPKAVAPQQRPQPRPQLQPQQQATEPQQQQATEEPQQWPQAQPQLQQQPHPEQQEWQQQEQQQPAVGSPAAGSGGDSLTLAAPLRQAVAPASEPEAEEEEQQLQQQLAVPGRGRKSAVAEPGQCSHCSALQPGPAATHTWRSHRITDQRLCVACFRHVNKHGGELLPLPGAPQSEQGWSEQQQQQQQQPEQLTAGAGEAQQQQRRQGQQLNQDAGPHTGSQGLRERRLPLAAASSLAAMDAEAAEADAAGEVAPAEAAAADAAARGEQHVLPAAAKQGRGTRRPRAAGSGGGEATAAAAEDVAVRNKRQRQQAEQAQPPSDAEMGDAEVEAEPEGAELAAELPASSGRKGSGQQRAQQLPLQQQQQQPQQPQQPQQQAGRRPLEHGEQSEEEQPAEADAAPQSAAKRRRTQPEQLAAEPSAEAAGAAAEALPAPAAAGAPGSQAKCGRGGGPCRWADSQHLALDVEVNASSIKARKLRLPAGMAAKLLPGMAAGGRLHLRIAGSTGEDLVVGLSSSCVILADELFPRLGVQASDHLLLVRLPPGSGEQLQLLAIAKLVPGTDAAEVLTELLAAGPAEAAPPQNQEEQQPQQSLAEQPDAATAAAVLSAGAAPPQEQQLLQQQQQQQPAVEEQHAAAAAAAIVPAGAMPPHQQQQQQPAVEQQPDAAAAAAAVAAALPAGAVPPQEQHEESMGEQQMEQEGGEAEAVPVAGALAAGEAQQQHPPEVQPLPLAQQQQPEAEAPSKNDLPAASSAGSGGQAHGRQSNFVARMWRAAAEAPEQSSAHHGNGAAAAAPARAAAAAPAVLGSGALAAPPPRPPPLRAATEGAVLHQRQQPPAWAQQAPAAAAQAAAPLLVAAAASPAAASPAGQSMDAQSKLLLDLDALTEDPRAVEAGITDELVFSCARYLIDLSEGDRLILCNMLRAYIAQQRYSKIAGLLQTHFKRWPK